MSLAQLSLKTMSDVADFLLSTLYPPRCMGCGAFLSIRSGTSRLSPKNAHPVIGCGQIEMLMSGQMCPDCLDTLVTIKSPYCTCCGEEFISRTGADHLCGACAAESPAFDSARSALLYEGGLANAIIRMKYKGRMEFGRPLGYLIADAYLRNFSADPPDLAVPVPLHYKRLRKRGYNQVMLLLADWPEFSGFPPVVTDVIKRFKPTPAQASLDRAHRAANVRKAFAVVKPEYVKGNKILLIDDVYTTGATSRECAKILKKAGAARVDVLTLARVAAGV